MRKDKLQIFELRKQGKSYREIQQIFNISRSTLSDWFKNEEWSNHIRKSKVEFQRENKDTILANLRAIRMQKLNEFYDKVSIEAVEEFSNFKDKPLFIAGLMLYAGEGDKTTRHLTRLANIDFDLHKIFIKFIRKFMGASTEEIKIGILLYPDLDVEECRNKWSIELGIPVENFHKPMVIRGKHKTRRLHFGVGYTILIGTSKKKKLLTWLELAKKYLT